MYQITKIRLRPGGKVITIEDEHKVQKLVKFLPAGPTSDGGHREQALVQFIARDGGLRTVNAGDLTLL